MCGLNPFSGLQEVAALGECVDIEIDSQDRIWLAGEKGLAIGKIDPGGALGGLDSPGRDRPHRPRDR